MFLQDAGVNREVIDTLFGLVFQRIQNDVAIEIFDAAVDDHGIDGHGSNGHGAVPDDGVSAGVQVASGGQIHHRVGSPAF